MMKTLVKVFVFVCSFGAIVQPQTVDPELATRLQQALDSLRTANGLPGLTAALILPDGAIWKGASNLTTDDLVGIASHTKTMMAALTMKLVEDGTLGLDDPLHTYLPAMTNIDSAITIRQLLGMRAGIRDFTSYPNFWSGVMGGVATTRLTTTEILNLVGTPLFAPGAGFEYVNTNYLLMQMIIESKTGRPIQDLLRERLWTPLGLSRTYYYGRDSLVPPVAPGHHVNTFWESRMSSHFDRVFTTFTGSGNVFATMEDLARWIRKLYGDQTVLSAASMEEMTRYYPVGTAWYGDPYTGYGLGTMAVAFGGYATVGHDGGLLAHASHGRHFPALGVTISLAYNYMDDNVTKFMRLYSSFLEVYLKQSHSPAFPPPRSLIVAGGVPDSGAIYEIDTSSFSHRLIGRNYYTNIAGFGQQQDGYLSAFVSDLVGWHLDEWNGSTATGPPITRMASFSGAPIHGFAFRPDSLPVFSYYGGLNKFNTVTGQATVLRTVFPGTSAIITGIANSPGGTDLWLAVNKGTSEPDLIYRVNPATGDTLRVGSAGLGVQLNDIAFSPDRELYAVTADSPARLVRINQSNAQATVVGTLNLNDARCLAFTGEITSVDIVSTEIPTDDVLLQNYPNPFNPKTVISYKLSVISRVNLRIFDVLGREVATLVNEEQPAGVYQAEWNARVASGVYFYRLEAMGSDGTRFVETKKMILVR